MHLGGGVCLARCDAETPARNLAGVSLLLAPPKDRFGRTGFAPFWPASDQFVYSVAGFPAHRAKGCAIQESSGCDDWFLATLNLAKLDNQTQRLVHSGFIRKVPGHVRIQQDQIGACPKTGYVLAAHTIIQKHSQVISRP